MDKRHEWKEPPVILRATDAVMPGGAFTLYGEGFSPDSVNITVKKDSSEYHPPIVISDPEGQFATFTLPDDIKPGICDITAFNQYGGSASHKLNAARPQWISTDEAAPGLVVKLAGRNIDGREFGSINQSRVKLSNGTNEFEAAIKKVNPFAVDFVAPDNTPPGVYDVLMCNDGETWRALEFDQQLKIVDKGLDPYNLGVSWAREFKWENVFNVMDYGAKADGVTDDTEAVDRAARAAKDAGGGVVYFPNGRFALHKIRLQSGVVAAGSGMNETTLVYIGTGGENFIGPEGDACKKGYTGVINIGIELSHGNRGQIMPAAFIYFGNVWKEAIDKKDRTAQKIFIKSVRLKYPVYYKPDRRFIGYGLCNGFGITIMADRHVLIEDNHFTGGLAGIATSYISQYVSLKNNDFYVYSASIELYAAFTVAENNTMKFTPYVRNDQLLERRAFDLRLAFYAEGNTVINCATDDNEGENFNSEANCGTTKTLGKVVSATADTITVDPVSYEGKMVGWPENWGEGDIIPYVTWDIVSSRWGNWNIVITSGRGLGQYREITASDEAKKTFTLNRPWDIVPDETSTFYISTIIKASTIYKNTIINGGKPMLFYHTNLDCVIAGNKNVNSAGAQGMTAYISCNVTKSEKGRMSVQYHNRIENNKCTGYSASNEKCGIGFTSGIESVSDFGAEIEKGYGYLNYGNVIRYNKIKGSLPVPPLHKVAMGGIPINGIFVLNNGRNSVKPDFFIKSAIIEGNAITDSDRGFTIGSKSDMENDEMGAVNYGIVVKDNILTNVEEPLIDDGSEGLVLINNKFN